MESVLLKLRTGAKEYPRETAMKRLPRKTTQSENSRLKMDILMLGESECYYDLDIFVKMAPNKKNDTRKQNTIYTKRKSLR